MLEVNTFPPPWTLVDVRVARIAIINYDQLSITGMTALDCLSNRYRQRSRQSDLIKAHLEYFISTDLHRKK